MTEKSLLLYLAQVAYLKWGLPLEWPADEPKPKWPDEPAPQIDEKAPVVE